MPLGGEQAERGKTSENMEEQGRGRSEFKTELLAAVQEQRDLLKEYKDRHDGRVLQVVDIPRPVSNVEFCMHRMQFKQCIMRKPI